MVVVADPDRAPGHALLSASCVARQMRAKVAQDRRQSGSLATGRDCLASLRSRCECLRMAKGQQWVRRDQTLLVACCYCHSLRHPHHHHRRAEDGSVARDATCRPRPHAKRLACVTRLTSSSPLLLLELLLKTCQLKRRTTRRSWWVPSEGRDWSCVHSRSSPASSSLHSPSILCS